MRPERQRPAARYGGGDFR